VKKQKIALEDEVYLISSNDCEDGECPVCLLMKECELGGRDPTEEEINKVMLQRNA
jgi:hypothetical protein